MRLQLARDFDEIRKKYIEVIENTANMDVYARWKYGQHPTDEMLRAYINRGEMYGYMEEEKIAGMVALTMCQDADYEHVQWGRELSNEDVLVIHILAVCPDYQKKGIAGKIVLEAIELAKKNGKKAVRLDALATNKPAQHLYESLGFAYRGKRNLYAENTGWTDFLYYEFEVV